LVPLAWSPSRVVARLLPRYRAARLLAAEAQSVSPLGGEESLPRMSAPTTTKERILEALRNLPPDATVDDAIERLVFMARVEEGLA